MGIAHQVEDTVATVKLNGSFTFEQNQHFHELITSLQEKHVSCIKIDFSNVDFIDSAGLGMILLLRNSLEKTDTSIILSKPSGQIEKMFSLSKFDTLFTIE